MSIPGGEVNGRGGGRDSDGRARALPVRRGGSPRVPAEAHRTAAMRARHPHVHLEPAKSACSRSSPAHRSLRLRDAWAPWPDVPPLQVQYECTATSRFLSMIVACRRVYVRRRARWAPLSLGHSDTSIWLHIRRGLAHARTRSFGPTLQATLGASLI